MTFRRRLAVLATVASGLLVAGLLLSAPAFAWTAGSKGSTPLARPARTRSSSAAP
jgi:hypothetical protein